MLSVAAIPYDVESSVEERILRAASIGADLVELRLDYWKGDLPEFSRYVKLARTYGMDVIVTVRDPSEGGVRAVEWKGEALKIAKELNCWCDVEARLYSRPPCGKAIASIHFFKKISPEDLESLRKLSKDKLNFAIFKVAAYVSSLNELLELRDSVNHPRRAFMPMGESTEKLRLATPLLGSYLTYGSVDRATAPGQVPLELVVKAVELARRADELYSPER